MKKKGKVQKGSFNSSLDTVNEKGRGGKKKATNRGNKVIDLFNLRRRSADRQIECKEASGFFFLHLNFALHMLTTSSHLPWDLRVRKRWALFRSWHSGGIGMGASAVDGVRPSKGLTGKVAKGLANAKASAVWVAVDWVPLSAVLHRLTLKKAGISSKSQ